MSAGLLPRCYPSFSPLCLFSSSSVPVIAILPAGLTSAQTHSPVMDSNLKSQPRHLIDRLAFPALVAPLMLLAGITGYVLFLSSDPSVNALFTALLEF